MSVTPLTPALIPDFFKFHSNPESCGWCYCIAWWVTNWDGFMQRTPEQNRALRQDLFDQGVFDGFLLYRDDAPIGWCQVFQRDRMPRMLDQFSLTPDPQVWAIGCMIIDSGSRRKGMARYLLKGVIDHLRESGVEIVETYPLMESVDDPSHLWRGPIEVYRKLGFKETATRGSHSILRLELSA